MFALTVSIVKSKNIKEAMADHTWIDAMQEELHQSDRLRAWKLVDKLFGKTVIGLKWLWKNRMMKTILSFATSHVLWIRKSGLTVSLGFPNAVSLPNLLKMALPIQNINHSTFRLMFKREKLSGDNFNEWFRQLKLVLRVEKKIFVIEQPLPAAPASDSKAQVLAQWNAVYDAYNEVDCLILGSMTPKLHKQFENSSPYDMIKELKSMFEKQARVERFELIQTFYACKKKEGKQVGAYVLKMKDYVEQLECLGYVLPHDISLGLIMNGLTSDFAGFIRNYNMHNIRKTFGELHALLIKYEKEHPTKDGACHHCKEVGHWKRNYPVYLVELIKKKKQVGTASSLETATRILDMVPTKKVDKKPYELWYEKVPNLSYLKVCGCEALVKRDMPDKLQ
uniref:Zinc finger, CCHC-type n=1 Tax=Tanacetum cinerariifolium TaxID=118510 RepID=A0A6L2JHW3_TANCI|nr:hypothetical protein [Tanacetum cinerariifolium]